MIPYDVVIEKETATAPTDDLSTTGSEGASNGLFLSSLLQEAMKVKENGIRCSISQQMTPEKAISLW